MSNDEAWDPDIAPRDKPASAKARADVDSSQPESSGSALFGVGLGKSANGSIGAAYPSNEEMLINKPKAPLNRVTSATADDGWQRPWTGPEVDARDPSTEDEVAAGALQNLGIDLAHAIQEGGYHPVVLFGTNNSGKTSLLLSLFAAIGDESWECGLAEGAALLGSSTPLGRQLHDHAVHTFQVKTQAFREGEKIPATKTPLPYFIPVELRPSGKEPARFVFLESNGEWIRPMRGKGQTFTSERLYPALQQQIEDFIGHFQRPITFLYLAPYTQNITYSSNAEDNDAEELLNASLAIDGMLRAYDTVRTNHRDKDMHIMLVTKWDASSARESSRAEALREDHSLVTDFLKRRYNNAYSTFVGMQVDKSQRKVGAYSAGQIDNRGRRRVEQDDELHMALKRYPRELWSMLYRRALVLNDMSPTSPFPEPKRPSALMRFVRRTLDMVSG
jgi:hypothetical protein